MVVVGEDKTLYAFDANFLKIAEIKLAHNDPIFTCEYIDDNIVATGDDEGVIKIWDLRTSVMAFSVEDQKGSTTTGIRFDKEPNFMVATNASGTLGVYDLRKNDTSQKKLYALSDEMEEELNCLELCKVI